MVISLFANFSCALVLGYLGFVVIVDLGHQRVATSIPGCIISLGKFGVAMMGPSCGWFCVFFTEELVDLEKEVGIMSVLIIIGAIWIIPYSVRMGVS